MSLITWMPDELRSEIHSWSGKAWRFVEPFHLIATNKIVNPEFQSELEELIDEYKPRIPIECEGLNFQLYTPFRYFPTPRGSRFRSPKQVEGVWYGAEHETTALSEVVYHRLMTLNHSTKISFPKGPIYFTSYTANISTNRMIDLTSGKMLKYSEQWMDKTKYDFCQEFANEVRKIQVELIRYSSVRDLEHRANLAVLSCKAFATPQPLDQHTWRVYLNRNEVVAVREFPNSTVRFDNSDFIDMD